MYKMLKYVYIRDVRIVHKTDEEGLAVDINEEIARLRREAGNAAAEARTLASARSEARSTQSARHAANVQQLLPLGQTFVRWAEASRIKPTALAHRVQNLLIYVRSVPTLKGWPLQTYFEVPNEDRGGYGGNKRVLAVLRSGEIIWIGKNVIVSRDEAERAIAAYVVSSGSTVPWPGEETDRFHGPTWGIEPGRGNTYRDTPWS